MVKEGKLVIVMLADMGAVHSLHNLGMAVDGPEGLRLKPDFVSSLAKTYADNLNGKVVRLWFDRGHFAEIEIGDVYAENRLKMGTRVRTLRALHNNAYMSDARLARRWGVRGKVVGVHDSHGLCYDVRHDGCFNGVGTYEPDEIEVL